MAGVGIHTNAWASLAAVGAPCRIKKCRCWGSHSNDCTCCNKQLQLPPEGSPVVDNPYRPLDHQHQSNNEAGAVSGSGIRSQLYQPCSDNCSPCCRKVCVLWPHYRPSKQRNVCLSRRMTCMQQHTHVSKDICQLRASVGLKNGTADTTIPHADPIKLPGPHFGVLALKNSCTGSHAAVPLAC